MATGASSLELSNSNGTVVGLVSDEKLAVKSESNDLVDSNETAYLRISVKDRLNQTVTKGSSDSG